MKNIYLYGMILASNSFLLSEFVKPDEYSEIQEHFRFPGGETGTCASVLSSLGANVVLDGTHIGKNVMPLLKSYYADKTVNCDLLYYDETYAGLEDYILISGDVRTPFGSFGQFYSDARNKGLRRWNKPHEAAIKACDVAAIDPYFLDDSELAAEYCVKHNKPYITIDCKYDSFLHKHAAVSIISGEGIHENYPGQTYDELFPLYQENGGGLSILTRGGKDFFCGRRGSERKVCTPFQVDVKSTLGAGDTFKAGCAYALSMGMADDALVSFASACSAVAISDFPLPLHLPTLEKIQKLLQSK